MKQLGRIVDYKDFFKTFYIKDNCVKIDGITKAVSGLSKQVEALGNKVDNIEEHMDHIDGRLEIIGEGTKMELLDTLYHWKKVLTERGWKTKAEMKEIEDIYKLYHDNLHGNGQGTQYYNDIKALEDKEITNE